MRHLLIKLLPPINRTSILFLCFNIRRRCTREKYARIRRKRDAALSRSSTNQDSKSVFSSLISLSNDTESIKKGEDHYVALPPNLESEPRPRSRSSSCGRIDPISNLDMPSLHGPPPGDWSIFSRDRRVGSPSSREKRERMRERSEGRGGLGLYSE